MKFVLLSPELNFLYDSTKIRAQLTTGIVEILEQHQFLLGKINNELIEYETFIDTKVEKRYFVVKDAVLIVNNPPIEKEISEIKKETYVYVTAKRGFEITPSFSSETINKEYEQKNLLLENELQRLKDTSSEKLVSTKTLLLESDLEFLKKVLSLSKSINFKS
jgi:hypothetical protein